VGVIFIEAAMRSIHLARTLVVAAVAGLFSTNASADDELLVYVFQGGQPVSAATVSVDGVAVGQTMIDGSLFADLSEGGHVITVEADGTRQSLRVASNSGQLVDVALDLDSENGAKVDVYSGRESAAERRGKALGTLQVAVTRDGAPVEGVIVNLSSGGGVASSNTEGVATTNAPRGRYTLTVDGQQYNVRIFAGVVRGASVALASDTVDVAVAAPVLEEVFVLGSFDPTAFEVSERDTGNIVDTLGVEQLARYGDSDVAASVVRVPGVSVQNDKYVVIRGLGDRYVTANLNGSAMPSTNPSRRTVPLDLFPSSFVNQLDVKKTYLASMPGESTGGNLVINTKTFPDEAFLEVSFKAGGVTGLTNDSVGVDPLDGDFDALGWDDGTREENIAVATIAEALRIGSITDSNGNTFQLDNNIGSELRRAAGLLMMDGWDADTATVTPDVDLGISAGDIMYVGDAEIGYFAAASYSNSWSQRESGVRRTYGGGSDIVADDFQFETATNSVEASGIVSIGLGIGDSTYEWNNIVSRITDSFVERLVGVEGDEFRSVVGTSIQWEERQYASTQILGSHFLNTSGSLFLEWQATASQAERDVPDRRTSSFIASQSQTAGDVLVAGFDYGETNLEQGDLFNGFFFNYGGSSRRFNNLIDNNYEVSADLTWDVFDNGDSFGVLKVGLSAIERDRIAEAAIYGYSTILAGDVVAADNASVSDVVYACGEGTGFNVRTCQPVVNGDVTSPALGGVQGSVTRGLTFTESTLPSDNYEADLTYNSAYVLYDHTFGLDWQVIGGVRFEEYSQTTETFSSFSGQPVDSIIDESVSLPHLGINWSFTDTQQLRIAVSETVARPDFKETANAYYQDLEFGAQVFGNPFLETSAITNADVRWEWYFDEAAGNSVSVALFYKEIEDAIERVVIAASGTAANARTFQNSDLAELTGVEIEGRISFPLNDSGDSELFIDLNAASIDSEVDLGNGLIRAMQGQPEYTANLIIGYDNFASDQQVTLLLNQNGDTVADRGIQGAADVILEPRLDVQLVYRWDISEALSLRAKVNNLLNEEFEYTQGGRVFQRYERGTSFQVGIDWEI
jgi:TonB-dependent receptor